MGLFDFLKKSVEALYIARPEEQTDQLIWRYPKQDIPNGSKVTVRSDEMAVFFRGGRLAGRLEAGEYVFETGNIPFLGELLVSSMTGANHYLAEVFFVRKAEWIHSTSDLELLSTTDRKSQNLVTIKYRVRFGAQVEDPVKIITMLGGQGSGASAEVNRWLSSRLKSLLAASVGRLLAEHPVLDIVSNQHNEEIGGYVLQQARDEFLKQGLVLTRFLNLELRLDEESEAALRSFGSRQAELAIQREGAEVAQTMGFRDYHLAQGQRAALQGLGDGFSSGQLRGPIMGVDLAFGGGGSSSLIGGSGRGRTAGDISIRREQSTIVPSARGGANRTAPIRRWYLRGKRGQEGPYNVRQLVLRAISEGLTPETTMIRGETDPVFFSADSEEAIEREFRRRLSRLEARGDGAKIMAGESTGAVFEAMFNVASSDGIITRDELKMLLPLVVQAGRATNDENALAYITGRARSLGCTVEVEGGTTTIAGSDSGGDPPPPPPPPPAKEPQKTSYHYYDGDAVVTDLSAASVAARVRANPSGHHVVWNKELGAWKVATDVAEISLHIDQDQ